MKHVIELKDIKKIYHIGGEDFAALAGITLNIEEGEFARASSGRKRIHVGMENPARRRFAARMRVYRGKRRGPSRPWRPRPA